MRRIKIIKFIGSYIFFGLILFSTAQAGAFVFQDKVSTAKGLAHYAMGQIYDFLGVTNRAILEYQEALQYDETSYLIHLRLGADYARLGMLLEAKEELRLVNQYHPGELQSRYLLALIYSTEKQYDKAAEEYEFILKTFSQTEPQNVEIYSYLGQLYYSQRKYDQAIEQFERMLALEPGNADVMYLLGSLYLEIDQKQRAVELLKRSIEIDSEHDGSLNTLGYLYAENNEHLDEAIDLIRRALEISPDNGAYLDSLGWVHYKKGEYAKALEILEQADGLLEDPVIRDHMGDVYYKLNRLEDAVRYWELSLELLPDQEKVSKKISDVKSIQAKQNYNIPPQP